MYSSFLKCDHMQLPHSACRPSKDAEGTTMLPHDGRP